MKLSKSADSNQQRYVGCVKFTLSVITVEHHNDGDSWSDACRYWTEDWWKW